MSEQQRCAECDCGDGPCNWIVGQKERVEGYVAKWMRNPLFRKALRYSEPPSKAEQKR